MQSRRPGHLVGQEPRNKLRPLSALAASIGWERYVRGAITHNAELKALRHGTFPAPFSRVPQWMLTRGHSKVQGQARPDESAAAAGRIRLLATDHAGLRPDPLI